MLMAPRFEPRPRLRCVALEIAATLFQRIHDETAIEIKVITQGDEARLVRAGVLHGLPELFEQDAFCVDVGGGSTEMRLARSAFA